MLCDGYREERVMGMLDHVGIGVADYQRSKGFYERALAPLGYSLLLEFSGAAAGFGTEGGGRPSFFIEAHGKPASGRLHIAFGAESRELVDAFHAAALEAGGTDNGAPGIRWYHEDYYGAYVLDPDGNNVEAVCHRPAG
jgi:catechol 2,3-dioxygenase-like lactoylglutathione lyase family enzyme